MESDEAGCSHYRYSILLLIGLAFMLRVEHFLRRLLCDLDMGTESCYSDDDSSSDRFLSIHD